MPELLIAKITVPPATMARVERVRLNQLIQQGVEEGRRLVLVSAPAGFGKTTCVLAWLAESRPARVSWLSLDIEDDDPQRFYLYLIAAIQQSVPAAGRDLEKLLRSGQLPPADTAADALANDIHRFGREMTLVLDDFHILQNPACLKVIDRLANHLPHNLTLVLVSREDPSFSLARLRANRLLIEVRASDLRFSPAETRDFLSNVLGINLSGSDIDLLEESTEGWAAGLQLAGLSLVGRDDASTFIASLKGSRRFILNYLLDEVLDRQPGELRRFMLEISVLERFNAAVCEALSGQTNSRAMLERLVQANLFVIPLDEKGEWFRYHRLFADLLRDQLAGQDAEKTAQLHRRASEWFVRSGFPLEGINHALASGDHALAVDLLDKHALPLLFQGQTGGVEACLEAIPSEWRRKNIRTGLAFAWLNVLRGNFEKVLYYYQQLAEVLIPSSAATFNLAPDLQAEWLALQAALLSGQGQAQTALELAGQALQLAPTQNAYLLTLIHMSLASVYQQLDDYPRAVGAFREIIHHARLCENFDSEIMGYAALSQIMLMRGRYKSGFEVVSEGIRRVEESGALPPISAALYGSLGEIYLEWNNLQKGLPYYRRAARLGSLCGFSDGEICLRAVLSQQSLLAGSLPAARDEIDHGLEMMKRMPPAWVREVALAQKVRVELAAGSLTEAEAAFAEMMHSPGRPLEVPCFAADEKMTSARGYICVSALRILIHRAENLGEKNRLAEGLHLAGVVIQSALRGEFVFFAIETLLLRAHMQFLRGEESAARQDLLQAVQMGEKEGMLQIFIDSGQTVRKALAGLLEAGLPDGIDPAYAQRVVQAVCPRAPGDKPGRQEDSPPLTRREIELLRLMSLGLTYEEMAHELVVSLNTVRSHVKAVYAKLNTDNRTKAVLLGREMGLLES